MALEWEEIGQYLFGYDTNVEKTNNNHTVYLNLTLWEASLYPQGKDRKIPWDTPRFKTVQEYKEYFDLLHTLGEI